MKRHAWKISIRRTLAKMQNNLCAYCNVRVPDKEQTFDHLYPRSWGGRLDSHNGVMCCGSCNVLKGGRSVLFFLLEEERKVSSILKKVLADRAPDILTELKQHSILWR